MTSPWASKSVKEIDDTLMHLPKATGSSFLHFKGRCTINGGGFPTVSNKMTHKGFLAAFQVSMSFLTFCIDGTPQGFWQPTEDDNMPC